MPELEIVPEGKPPIDSAPKMFGSLQHHRVLGNISLRVRLHPVMFQ